ncbi:MAG: pitrilysin family protein [Nitrospinota bacterium]
MVEFEHSVKTLTGNLRCITVPIPSARSMTLMVLVRVGSRYEEKNVNGISHFMEHMFFKGAERYPDTMAVAGTIDRAGGAFNAFTSEEVVGYFVKISASKKEIAYDVLSDMLLNAKFDQQEIEREKGVIIEEIRMYHDDPMSQISLDFHALMFGDQPLGWDIAGPEETITSINRDNFLEHHSRYYYGSNCVVTAAGGITEDEHRSLCEKYFVFKKGSETAVAPPFKSMDTEKVFTRDRKTEQAHFSFGFLTSGAEHEDEVPLKVMNIILGGQMSSRLFYQIRERRGLAYYIHSGYSGYLDVGLFRVSAGVNLNKVHDAIKCAVEEIQKIKADPVTDEELNRAKENIKGHTDLAVEDSRRVASLYGLREILYRNIKTPDQLAEEVDAVTKEQILNVTRKYFTDVEMKLGVIGPYPKDTDWSKSFKLD